MYALNHVFIGKRPGRAVDRSQNMGPNYGNIFGHLGLSVNAQKLLWAVLWEFMH